MSRKYVGGLIGASPLAGDPVDLRTSGVFNLGSLGGDAADSGDADFDSVVLLLNGDGTNNQTAFTDQSASPYTITTFGNTHVDTTVKKFGSGSIEFDGSGDYLRTSDFGLTSGDFTIEAWVQLKAMPTSDSWPAAFSSWMEIVGVGTLNTPDGWQFRIGQTQLAFGTNLDTTAVTGTHGMSTGTWYHLAVTRSGNVYTLYVDGSSVGSATYTARQPGSGAYGFIGAETGQGAYLNGYIDDLRITKGVARYSSSFTPPASALPTTGTVAGAARPTRKWGGLVGRSLIASDALVKTGVLSLPELLQASYGALFDITFTAKGAGGGGNYYYTGPSGGAGGLAEATFSSADFGSSFKIVVGSGGTFWNFTGAESDKHVKDLPSSGTTFTNPNNTINISAASMTLKDNSVVYGLGGSHGFLGGAGGGGGFTGVFSGTTIQHGDAMLIASGGGGAGFGANGGDGGGTTGANASGTNAGGGGSQIAGGAAGYVAGQNATWSPGQALVGGTAIGGDLGGGGGGGGGYFGGGAGFNGDNPAGNVGGGGGSSFIHANGTNTTNTQGGGSAGGTGSATGTDGNLVITLPAAAGKKLTLSNTTGTISASASGSTYTITGAGVAEVTIS